ncbi:MAG: imidazole glycerol phosphate synthase subunit HisH [Gammaproteobacteria bacterium]|nr:imidazole glycerol phosphate synthase subunit HisH [Gammaproteobacteria bacterium]
MEKVAIVDYGMSNLHSVFSALTKVSNNKFDIQISKDPTVINNSDRVVFPGQGAAADCMHQINACGLAESIKKAAEEKPFLGICMGMQVLLDRSQENDGTECLGLLKGTVESFSETLKPSAENTYKIPHMGWNTIEQQYDHPIWSGIEQNSYFYFVHSYYISLADQGQSAGMTDYGIKFSSVLADGKVFAMQCHPEKSADNGLQLLTNFLNWNGN